MVFIDVSLPEYEELIKEHLATKHLHLGYYENDHDIEAIAFKNEEGNLDVFFDDMTTSSISRFEFLCSISNFQSKIELLN